MAEGKDDLFGGGSAAVPAANSGGARPGAGRPRGSLNVYNRDLRRYLEQLTGRMAIVEQYQLASMPMMTDEAAVRDVCRRFGCTPKEAAQLWLQAAALVYPRIYPSLGSIEVKAPGAPGGDRIEFDFEEFTDLEPEPVGDSE